MTRQNPRLLFVYNADGGLLTALMHAVHKQVRPETYPCSLCALTYGAVSMRRDWKKYVNSLDYDVVFHHRDDFAESYPDRQIDLPSVLVAEPGEAPRELIGRAELDAMADADALMARMEEVLDLEWERALTPREVA